MHYTRLLQFRLPLIRGADVIAVQEQLSKKRFYNGEPDGMYGPKTENSVKAFQASINLRPDGMVGPFTWGKLFSEPNAAGDETGEQTTEAKFKKRLQETVKQFTSTPSRYRDSVVWQMTKTGISIEGHEPEGSGGLPKTVGRVWRDLRAPLVQWSDALGVPVELIIATICTESGGNLNVRAREEPGYISDEETPHRVSPGIMQTLISTARSAVGNPAIDRAWLQQPANSIQAGTAYIASQWKSTNFDPPKVGCAYNAGGVYYNDGRNNRWKMRQYPIGTAEHANRFVEWFNDAVTVLNEDDSTPEMSFTFYLQSQ